MNPVPINLPHLPLPANEGAHGDGYKLELHADKYGRWQVRVVNEYGDWIDIFASFTSALDALVAASYDYPGAAFTPPDEEE